MSISSKYTSVIFSLLYCLFIFSAASAAGEDYHFVSIRGLVEQDIGRIVLPEVYKRLGLNIKITPMPGKRAEKEASTGNADGEIMRIWSYGEENPSLIRVPTPYYHLETSAFIRADSNIRVRSREELKSYSLVRVRGVKHTNNITRGLTRVSDVENSDQLMRFLQEGRAEIALTNTIDGLQVIKERSLEGIVPLPEPLAIEKLYHYIHRDHASLVPKVDAILKEMITSGEMEELIKQAEHAVSYLP